MTAYERRLEIAMWVAREIIPHEKRARSILARSRVSPEDIDELIQEAYTPDHTQVKDGAYRAFGPYIVRGPPIRRTMPGSRASVLG